MLQIQLDAYGGPDVLHLVEVPDPVPGAGQVVVKVDAAGITFVETQMRAGRSPRPGPPPEPPLVLGNGVEGRVVAVGDGVEQNHLGRRVVAATGGFGGYASHVVIAQGEALAIPDGLSAGQAVALLADGRTALALARAAAITSDDRVLVTAAAGGVGSLLVQLARRAGAKQVIAAVGGPGDSRTATVGAPGDSRTAAVGAPGDRRTTVATDAAVGGPGDRRTADATDASGGRDGSASGRGSGPDKAALARDLGADVVVDYRAPGWADQIAPVDVAFDGVGGDAGREVLELVTPGGRFLQYGAASGFMTDARGAADLGVTLIPGYALIVSLDDNRALVEQALTEAAAGRLRPVIGQTFALADAAAAHAAIEARATVGKTLLIPTR